MGTNAESHFKGEHSNISGGFSLGPFWLHRSVHLVHGLQQRHQLLSGL